MFHPPPHHHKSGSGFCKPVVAKAEEVTEEPKIVEIKEKNWWC
jgi:hypothetical protein